MRGNSYLTSTPNDPLFIRGFFSAESICTANGQRQSLFRVKRNQPEVLKSTASSLPIMSRIQRSLNASKIWRFCLMNVVPLIYDMSKKNVRVHLLWLAKCCFVCLSAWSSKYECLWHSLKKIHV